MVFYNGKNYTEQYGLTVMERDLAKLSQSDPNYQALLVKVIAQRKVVNKIESSYSVSNWDTGEPDTSGNQAQQNNLLPNAAPDKFTDAQWAALSGKEKLDWTNYIKSINAENDALRKQLELDQQIQAANQVYVDKKVEGYDAKGNYTPALAAAYDYTDEFQNLMNRMSSIQGKLDPKAPEYLLNPITKADAAEVKILNQMYADMARYLPKIDESTKFFSTDQYRKALAEEEAKSLQIQRQNWISDFDKMAGGLMDKFTQNLAIQYNKFPMLLKEAGFLNTSDIVDKLQDAIVSVGASVISSQVSDQLMRGFGEDLRYALRYQTQNVVQGYRRSLKYRYSAVPKKGYVKSKYGTYYYQAVI